MFSTKKDAVNWINCFSCGLRLEAKKQGKHWKIYDADGFALSEDRINELEDSKVLADRYGY